MEVLKTEKLKSYYIFEMQEEKKEVKAVNDVSISIREDEIYGIAGESGCGKSTFLKTICGLAEPPLRIVDGKIYYEVEGKEIDITKMSQEEYRKLRWQFISYIPQGSMSALNPIIRIKESFKDFVTSHKKIKDEEKEFEEPLKKHLTALGLPLRVLKSYPHQLSGGMRQRTTIALATILNPRIIVADEPTTALDVVAQRAVIQLLKDIQKIQKNTIILVTHDMAVHANITDRMGIMYAGMFVEEGETDEIFENPLHPYTKFLIGSLPKMGDKSYKVSAPGSPPSLASLPQGCPFHPRCPYAMEICKKERPQLVEISDGHKSACFLNSKERVEDARK
ncbi:oligopeptide/dipeptide ABC transporter, ATPase subunit [Petrotoga mobilis SJ95]|uniref:Oligopeptide/dipeptide ABC transporter, ATPase subunit n=1 Tax=Petrotoga mobilis (strain DSM 10674 / SJ95) TaxID=403833 RepID=A9BJ34_PETMO|nr:ABC transporter ATP-binding protein [Petrotoga mobilis]ABX30979.1 oligopeptide/dipeptide ABC transporter, ATPase subunit [Petrotoga mobilis SJ95]